jgi:serine/threonine protein phosphatase PrpC
LNQFAVSESAVSESHGVSHTGRVREHNEDGFLAEPASGIWVVADGMGGHHAGEVASASIIDHLSGLGPVASARELRFRFEDRLAAAHAEIRTLAKARGVTIGSTVAALLAMEGHFACLWAGDSRIYLVRNGSITQLTRDHTEAQELLDRGAITESEARNWPRRNVITQAVGVADEVLMECEIGQTLPGDSFVLATDGLTGHVSDGEIAAAVMALAPRAACEVLLDAALSRGGTDNITVIVVRFGSGRGEGGRFWR